MTRIGIVDDRKEQRDEIVLGITLSNELPKDWVLLPMNPLPKMEDYPSWVTENDITVLLVDEKLNEKSVDGGKHVTYYGHNLINYLRSLKGIFADFPIFVITAYTPTVELKEEEGNVEYIIPRKGWTDAAETWVPRIVRAGQRYFETNKNQLAELGRLAGKVASGEATEDDRKSLEAIRTSFELPFSTLDEVQNRSEWIRKFEETIHDFQNLKKEVEKDIENLSKENF